MSWEVPTCVICLQDLSSNLAAINCGHLFHTECILQCISNKTKNCPLCREKILPSRLLQVQFNLTFVDQPCKQLGMDDEESKNVEALQGKIRDLLNKIENVVGKSAIFEQGIKNKEASIERLSGELGQEKEKAKGFEEKYIKFREKNNELEYEVQKFQGLFKSTHKKMKEFEEKTAKLVNIEKLLSDIEHNQSSVTWANSARETLPLEDQASQFYSALLISSTTLKNSEKRFKDLQSEHGHCTEEIGKLKRINAALRKENERIEKNNTNVPDVKVNFT